MPRMTNLAHVPIGVEAGQVIEPATMKTRLPDPARDACAVERFDARPDDPESSWLFRAVVWIAWGFIAFAAGAGWLAPGCESLDLRTLACVSEAK